MRIDGIDYNVSLCQKMSKEMFIKVMSKHVAHLTKERQEVYLSEIYKLINGLVA